MSARLTLQGSRTAAVERARQRLMVVVMLFAGTFLVMAARIVELGLLQAVSEPSAMDVARAPAAAARADIVDRNGVVLATNLRTASLYADPARVLDAEEAAAKLARVLPDLTAAEVEDKLKSGRRFVWIKRKLTPRQVWQVNALGLPGLAFQEEEERVYPQGRLAAHVVGFTDPDGRGLAGVEHFFDARLSGMGDAGAPLRLTLDLRVQHALADELSRAVERFSARGAAGLVMDVETGELLALVSLPDFDPNHAADADADALFNRVTQGVYELGSTFKTFTVAMALEAGVVSLEDGYDATDPIRVARFLIRDDHPQKRYLTVPEIFAYSSNIGAAKMALDTGTERQQHFLQQLGLLRPAAVELAEVGRPIVPERWRDIATMTIAYGHGIAVSPLQLSAGVAAMVNGGVLIPATLVREPDDRRALGRQIISPDTSAKMRQLMRLVVTRGTGGQADVPGYRVGGKTGTAEKASAGGYARKALLSSFVGVFPVDAPRYLVFTLLDEPRGSKETFGYASAGWTAAPVAGTVVLRTAPLLGVAPAVEDEGLYHRVSMLISEKTRAQ